MILGPLARAALFRSLVAVAAGALWGLIAGTVLGSLTQHWVYPISWLIVGLALGASSEGRDWPSAGILYGLCSAMAFDRIHRSVGVSPSGTSASAELTALVGALAGLVAALLGRLGRGLGVFRGRGAA